MSYQLLVELGERELELITSGAWEDLAQLEAERLAVLAGLPAAPPPEARAALERMAGQQQLVTAALARGQVETNAELGRLSRGVGAVRGYATSAAQGGASMRLDDSA